MLVRFFLFFSLFANMVFADGKPKPFVAYQPGENFQLPEIILQYDPVAKTGADWEGVKAPLWHEVSGPIMTGRAANYLRDGLKRMTGKDFPIMSKNDLSKGIVLTLLKNAPEDIRKDPEVQEALKANPKDF
ncbi:MAG: hypothetical protein ABI443_06370, partial [Chthoniobacterales bacterium]